MGIANHKNEVIDDLLYDFISVPNESLSRINILAELANDHSDFSLRNIYPIFFDERGICKLVKAPEFIDKLQIPARFATEQCIQERTLLNRLLFLRSLTTDTGCHATIDRALRELCSPQTKPQRTLEYTRNAIDKIFSYTANNKVKSRKLKGAMTYLEP